MDKDKENNQMEAAGYEPTAETEDADEQGASGQGVAGQGAAGQGAAGQGAAGQSSTTPDATEQSEDEGTSNGEGPYAAGVRRAYADLQQRALPHEVRPYDSLSTVEKLTFTVAHMTDMRVAADSDGDEDPEYFPGQLCLRKYHRYRDVINRTLSFLDDRKRQRLQRQEPENPENPEKSDS